MVMCHSGARCSAFQNEAALQPTSEWVQAELPDGQFLSLPVLLVGAESWRVDTGSGFGEAKRVRLDLRERLRRSGQERDNAVLLVASAGSLCCCHGCCHFRWTRRSSFGFNQPGGHCPTGLPISHSCPKGSMIRPSRQPCSSATGDAAVAPAATACATIASGSSTTSKVRLVAPPIASGLKRGASGPPDDTQNAASPTANCA